jgi:hypothetical protein
MLTYAVIGMFLMFLVVTYVLMQGTRAALAWRQAAEKGDTKVIQDIVEDAIRGWTSQKRPKPVAAEVWRGVQSMQLVGVEADFVHVSVAADSDYKMVDGRWVEIRNPLQEGFGITAKAADLLLYELVHYKPARIQVDVYTQYRDQNGVTSHECVLSTYAEREAAKTVDWEEWTAEEIVRALGGVYRLSDTGRPLPIAPIVPPASASHAEARS